MSGKLKPLFTYKNKEKREALMGSSIRDSRPFPETDRRRRRLQGLQWLQWLVVNYPSLVSLNILRWIPESESDWRMNHWFILIPTYWIPKHWFRLIGAVNSFRAAKIHIDSFVWFIVLPFRFCWRLPGAVGCALRGSDGERLPVSPARHRGVGWPVGRHCIGSWFNSPSHMKKC